MNKNEAEAVKKVRDDLTATRATLPLRAEYVMGRANHGAAGAIDKAVKELTALLGEGEKEANDPAA